MPPFSPEELIEQVSPVGSFCLSPSGHRIAFSRCVGGESQLFVSPVDPFVPVQITFCSGFKKDPLWSPDGSMLAFVMDQEGDERFNIFVVPVDGGDVRQVTRLPGCFFRGYAWSPDGSCLAFSANVSGPHSIFTVRADGECLKRLTTASVRDHEPVWSPDGSCIAFTSHSEESEHSSVVIVDLSGERKLCASSSCGGLFAVGWIARGIRVVCSSRVPGAANLGLLDTATGKIAWSAAQDGETWRVWSQEHSACVIDVDGNTRIALLDNSTGSLDFFGPTGGLSSSPEFSSDGSMVLFLHEGPRNPSDLFVYRVGRGELAQLTKSLPDCVDSFELVEPVEIRYRSFDGLMIPALLYRPVVDLRGAVLRIHGGPHTRSFNKWDPTIQLLLSHGYLVLAPNFRGSIGYGSEFCSMSRNDWGGGDLQDVIAAADFLEESGMVDGDRIGIYGGSYGGYLMLMAMAKAPGRWACGVCLYGFSDLVEFHRSIPDWMKAWMESEIGAPEENPEFYRERSPISWCSDIAAPLLFLQGANDVRVPLQQSLLLKSVMEQHGKTLSLSVFLEEGHGFQKKANQISADRDMLGFFLKHSGKAGCSDAQD